MYGKVKHAGKWYKWIAAYDYVSVSYMGMVDIIIQNLGTFRTVWRNGGNPRQTFRTIVHNIIEEQEGKKV
jgi:hypothetical protein